MDRKTFAKSLLIGSVGLGFIPTTVKAVVGASKSIALVKLPEVKTHVRHGILEPIPETTNELPFGFQQIERNHFFSNGIDAGNDDLYHVVLKTNNKEFSLVINQNKVSISSGNETNEMNISQNPNVHCLFTDTIEIRLIHINRFKDLNMLNSQAFILPVHGGKYYTNEFVATTMRNDGLLINNIKSLELWSENDTDHFLMIQKKIKVNALNQLNQ